MIGASRDEPVGSLFPLAELAARRRAGDGCPGEIAFTVFGVAVPKARARTVKLPNGQISSYTPAKTREWERWIRAQAVVVKPPEPLDGPLTLEATFYLPRPKSVPRSRRYPEVKPDLDNLLKAVKDALRGLIYLDDSRIVEVRARKLYDAAPRVEVRVTPAA